MLGDIPVSRVIFRRPASGAGVLVEMHTKKGEQIMISEHGTPDPVNFSISAVMTFFRELGFLSGFHDEVMLDAEDYCPAGWERIESRPVISFGELRKKADTTSVQEKADIASVPSEAEKTPEELSKSSFSTTIYVLDDAIKLEEFSVAEIAQKGLENLEHPEDGEEYEEHREFHIGEEYLTTRNLIHLTSLLIVVNVSIPYLLPAAWEIRNMLYLAVGAWVALGVLFWLFEQRHPDHPSLQFYRYIWLCLMIFTFTMSISYVIGGKMLS
jgi:hypothetical protein